MIEKLLKLLEENHASLIIELGETLISNIGYKDYSYRYNEGRSFIEIDVNSYISRIDFLITDLNLKLVELNGNSIVIELYWLSVAAEANVIHSLYSEKNCTWFV